MSGQQMIHAAVLHGIGQTARYEPFPAPVATDGDAAVTVTAAALKPSDRWMANGGHYAPTTLPQVVGEVATLPAITLRSAPVQLFGSRIGGPAALGDAAAAYDSLLKQVAAGEIGLDIDPVPLARVEQVWPRAGSDRRVVFVP